MSGIYIHIPFCKQACNYCDFHFSTSLKKKSDLVGAIMHELVLRKDELRDNKIETIYFGGGTPSLLSNSEIESILDTIHKNFAVADEPEITLEANPDDLADSYQSEPIFEIYRKLGINRLSIGIQSFFEEDLSLMNRAHNAKEALKCLERARKFFDNISIDLIYGIQGLTNERWDNNIDIALSYELPHISSYALTVEPKTALAKFIKKGLIKDVNDAQSQEQFNILVNKLEAKGFTNYEISNFGKPHFFSRNNTAYWQGKPYLGIGPSAHSYNGNSRSWNVANNSTYMKAINENILPNEIESLSLQDKFNEYVMTGLRTIWGVSFSKVKEEFGLYYYEQLLRGSQIYIEKGLLQMESCEDRNHQKKLVATQKGKFLIDGIASDLFVFN